MAHFAAKRYEQTTDWANKALRQEPDKYTSNDVHLLLATATGEVTERFSADELCDALRRRGVPVVVADDVDEIVSALVADQRPGDVILVMSNGAFGGIWEKLLAGLKA